MQFAEAKSTEVVLNEIVARVRKFTNADGAAVAMRDGDYLATRATTGGLAPDLGARMSIDGSFTGLSLQQRKVLHCEDSDADSRVDPVLCRQLGIRSFVVVPIEGTKEAQGVLAAFSSAPHGFTRTDIAVVKTAADQIRQALANTPAADDIVFDLKETEVEKSKPQEPPAPARPAPTAPAPVAKIELPPPPPTVTPVITHAEPAKVEPRKSTVVLPPRVPVRPAVEPAPKPAQPEILSLAEEIKDPAAPLPAPPQPVDEQLPEGFREQYLEWKGFAEPERPARSSQKLLWIVAGCVVALLLAAVIVRGRLISQQNAKAASADVSKTREAIAPVALPHQPAPTPVAIPESAPAKPRATTPPVERASNAAAVATEKQPALMVDSSAPKPRTAPIVPDADAPQISIPSSNSAVLPDVKTATPGVPPPPPVKVSNLEPSELTHKVVPMFPRFTNAPPGTQTVVLRARVLVDGSVGDVQLVQGRPEFGESAKAAVKQWKYKPAQMNGKPVESSVTVTLNFKR